MKKNMFDIILGNILREREEGKIAQDDEKEKTMENEAKKQVKKREREKLAKLLKEEEETVMEKVKRARRHEEDETEREAKERKSLAHIESLKAPTSNLTWDLVDNNIHHIRAELGGEPAFEVRQGLVTYKLRLLHSKTKGGKSIKQRAESAGIGNNFSSIDVYKLKEKADRIVTQINEFEQKQLKNENSKLRR